MYPRARLLRRAMPFRWLRGWRPLASRLSEKSGRFLVDNRHGRFQGDLGSHIERELYLFGGYEDDIIDQFIGFAERRGVALDIGANIGSHTVALAQKFDRVIAFEPNPTVVESLRENVALNRLINVEIRPVGLGDKSGRIELHDIDGGNKGLASVIAEQDEFAGQFNIVHQIDIHRADDVCRDLVVDAIKIDIQGFEPNAFAGMQQLLHRSRPVVWSEISHETLSQIGPDGAASFFPYPVDAFKIERVSRFGVYRTVLRKCERILSFGDYFFRAK